MQGLAAQAFGDHHGHVIGRLDRQGAAIAARFFTTQSVKINRPRDTTHIMSKPTINPMITRATISGNTHDGIDSDIPVSEKLVDRKFQSPFPGM